MKDDKVSLLLDAMRKSGDVGTKRANDILKKLGSMAPLVAAPKKP
jgi:hypothetical protein